MITKKLFEVYNGKELYAYTLTDEVSVTVLTLGATVLSLQVPDKTGAKVDVALGMTSANALLNEVKYMGAIVGRCANRIAGGRFALNGKQYQVTPNDGSNSLHGGEYGTHSKVFEVVEVDENANSITLRTELPDGEDGYPAKLVLCVKYTVVGSSLIIDHYAESDNDTLCNPTNHAYFNLNGESDGSILDNVLYVNADSYLQVGDDLIPTQRVSVSGTPFDFRMAKPIGKDIEKDDAQLRIGKGYDHNYCLNGEHAATVYSTKTGIQMDVFTDMAGMQLYTANYLTGEQGKSAYPKHSGFCLETQFYPDAINRDDCAQPILKKGEQFHSQTKYVFSVTK